MKSFCQSRYRARRLFWTIPFFVFLQVTFTVALDQCNPELVDPEYHVRLSKLRSLQKEAPDRPLLLVLGSSRTAMSFKPEAVSQLSPAQGKALLPFNFSHYGAGPLFNLMELQRLLADGIKPAWLVV